MNKLLFSWLRRLHVSLLLLLAVPASAQRLVQSISSDWLFRKGELTTGSDGWEKVSLPHTWNATDVLDDEPGYYRGVGTYKKTLTVPADWQRRRVFLRFEGPIKKPRCT
ncbi:hypothetical protein [Hymenobacter volaticus]|uniref:Glycosyl hydrolases family 2 sugar binding domain-containing protein n=1 Tax=Hymenobacter volaticus TaxID=2932254 RepID=A0ABY4GCR1_9BACT|nr:hypothetical protein [Hymenobacter volaticus]UOQ68557.1 hypothetical protein MUN86_23930 [Hymenobacter volaticus]